MGIFDKKNNHIINLFFAFLFASVSFFLVGFHEMWRDEAQAWLIAKNSNSFVDLFLNLKYEGHPALWHLLLLPLTRLFDSIESMQYFHVTIAVCTIFIFFKWSPFSIIEKVLISFGYYFFYEYSIISRNYAIGILLIFSICSIFNKNKEHPFLISILLFLLSHTSIFGLIFALSIFFSMLFDSLFVNDKRDFKITHLQYIGSLLVVLFGFLSSILQMTPPVDHQFSSEWRLYPKIDWIFDIYSFFVKSYIPYPNFGNLEASHLWWNSNLFYETVSLKILGPIMLFFLTSIIVYLNSKSTGLFLFVISSAGLVLFFLSKYQGGYRHLGFLFVSLLSAIWISRNSKQKSILKIPNHIISLNYKFFKSLFFIILLINFIAGIKVNIQDVKEIFSSAKQTFIYLDDNKLPNSIIISHPSWSTSTILAYLNDKQFYYPDRGEFGTFVKWDKYRLNNPTIDDLQDISEKFRSDDKDVLLIVNSSIEKFDTDNIFFEKIYNSSKSIIGDEIFHIYKLK